MPRVKIVKLSTVWEHCKLEQTRDEVEQAEKAIEIHKQRLESASEKLKERESALESIKERLSIQKAEYDI